MSAHTKAPWIIRSTSCLNQIGFGELRGTACIPIGCVYGDPDSDDTKANAALCIASPLLLEALKQSAEGWANAIELNLLPPQHVMTASILRDAARAAIDAAEGKQS